MSSFPRGGDPYRSSAGDLGVSERWDSERFIREHAGRHRPGRRRESVGREPMAAGRQSLTSLEIDRERGRDRDRIGVSRQRRQSLHFEDEVSSFDGSSRGSPPRSVATTAWTDSRGRHPSLAYDRPYAPAPPPFPQDLPPRSRPRPQSFASFDRRPYEYEGRSEYRAPLNVPIPLPRPRRLSPRRRREIDERDYEEIRVSEPDRYGDREYREIRERDRHVRRRSKSTTRYGGRSSSSSLDDFERDRELPRGGRTRIPARLVSRRAVAELGYPYEEQGDTIIILRALGRHHIDELIIISEEIRRTQPQSVFRTEETRVVRAIESAPTRRETIETRTQYIPPPPPNGIEIVREERVIPTHRGHRTEVIEVGESDGRVSGPLSVFAPDRRAGERSIKAEIRALEAEKKALRLEREVEHENRRAETLIIEERDGRRAGDIVIKKNRKGRLEMVR